MSAKIDVDKAVVEKFLLRNDIPIPAINVDLLFSTVHEIIFAMKKNIVKRKSYDESINTATLHPEFKKNASDILNDIIVSEIGREKNIKILAKTYPPLNSLAQSEVVWLIKKIAERIINSYKGYI
jgi:hypothetical protein